MYLQQPPASQAPLLDSSQLSPQQKMAIALMQQNSQQPQQASSNGQNPNGQSSALGGMSQMASQLMSMYAMGAA